MAVTDDETLERRAREVNPYVKVGLGVVLVCAAVVVFTDLDLHAWGVIHGDSTKVYKPGGVYGDGWDSARFEPFSGGRLGWQEVLLGVLAYGGTFVVGERILRILTEGLRWPAPLRIGGAFLIGYVPVFAAVRLVTLRFNADVAPWMCLVLLTAAAVTSLVVDARAPDLRVHSRGLASRTVRNRTVWIVVALFLGMVVWTVQSGRNYLVSDSVILFLEAARGDLGSMHWLPAFGRQADEYYFNYPMIYAFKGASTFAIWFWLTNALAKASMVCLIAGFAWTLSKGKWFVATLAAALVLFASSVADPRYYVSIFGGQNPTIFLGHAGRFLGIVLPFLAVPLLSRGSTRAGRWLCVVFGIAVMATTASNIAFAGVVIVLLFAFVVARRQLRNRSDAAKAVLAHRVGIAFWVGLLAPLAAYGTLGTTTPGLGGLPLLVGAAAVAFALAGLAVDTDPAVRDPDDEYGEALFDAKTTRVVPLAVGAVLGMLTMGNLFYRSLIEIAPYRWTMETLFPAYKRTPLFVAKFDTKIFTHASCQDVPTPACGSFKGWVGYFAVTFLLIGLGWIALSKSKAPAEIRRRDSVLLGIQLLLLNIGLFLTDFLGAADVATYWTQTRFLEIGYYGVLIMAPVIAWNHLQGPIRNAALATLAVWVVVPFVLHPFVPQWWENFFYLKGALT